MLTLLAIGGCTAARPAAVAPPPPVTLDAVKSVGSPLATTSPAVDAVDPAALVGLDVTWVALAKMPADALLPLDAQASLASAPLDAGPVLTRGRDARLVRFGRGTLATDWLARQIRRADGPAQQIGHQVAWVAPGTTVRLSCAAATPTRSIAVAVYRPIATSTTQPTPQPSTMAATEPTTTPATQPDAAADFAIALRGLSATQPSDEPTGPETAYIDALPLSPETPYALVLPWPSAGGSWQALAAYIRVLPSTAPHADEAAAEWNAFLAARGGRPAAAASQPGDHLTLHRAIDALRQAPDPRPALTYLASVTQARFAADVALVADGNLLKKLQTAITAADTAAATPEAVGWLLDRTALLTLADAGAKAPLPPEMVAALTVYAGEVGRHPDTLGEIVNSVANAADLHTRLVGENYVALEDNAAAARVRAYDWLRAGGNAPADYDPLGPARARRAAINRAITAPGGPP